MKFKIPYINWKIRLMISAVASLIILFHGRWRDVPIAFVSPSFYVAFVVSIAICFLMMYITHRTTKTLDRKLDWWRRPLQRLSMQLVLGVALPLAADLLLVGIYFSAQGRNFMESGFLLTDFPFIIGFVLVLNAYYMTHYLYETSGHSYRNIRLNGSLTFRSNGGEVTLDIEREILYLKREGRQIILVTTSGKTYLFYGTIERLQRQTNPYALYRINRSVMVNMHTLSGFVQGVNRGAIHVQFKPAYRELAGRIGRDHFTVTEARSGHFKLLLDQHQRRQQNVSENPPA